MKPARPWMLVHLKIIWQLHAVHQKVSRFFGPTYIGDYFFLLILIFFNLLNLFWHTDKNFCFYVEVNFWDFVRNDYSNKGTTARLNETRFGPKKKSSPIYLAPKNLDTFWCTACNCQIILWNRHGHECSRIWKLSGNCTQCIKKCQDFLGQDILGMTACFTYTDIF
jgi:hypothetical protein